MTSQKYASILSSIGFLIPPHRSNLKRRKERVYGRAEMRSMFPSRSWHCNITNPKVTKGMFIPYIHSHISKQIVARFHCEGKALRTIFGILFWDIIFAPIPGAFETPYQTAPLDISHESFYTSRQHLIDERLHDIRHGKAHEILEAIDIKHRERATWCVGVNWDAFERQDLLEIVDVSSH